MIKLNYIISIAVVLLLSISSVMAQLSPGELSSYHEHLEGISNCTKCHVLGEKVTNEKCLDCHTELKSRIQQEKGYHFSAEVRNKDCFECHNDHHGRDFEIIRFDENSFDHRLTGYNLEGSHNALKCNDCHNKDHIQEQKIKDKKYTYLGLNKDCLSCHKDTHQKTLSSDCLSCHDFQKFKPAPIFNHINTEFQLAGKHKEVECIDCHKKVIQNGQEFQQFANTDFSNCTSCHTDVHKNKFGQNCVECHSVNSFKNIKNSRSFNHDKTRFVLLGKHKSLDCKICHKNKLTDPLAFNKCLNCHEDYHRNQFLQNNAISDCSDCHSNNSFSQSSYDVSRHNLSKFPLEGPHMATPCFMCHKKDTDRWEFKNIGLKCVDCHTDVHESNIDPKYYPESNCKECHKVSKWKDVNFNHDRTDFKLEGKHTQVSCYDCHYRSLDRTIVKQNFSYIDNQCTNCHMDIHYRQFDKNGLTACIRCHTFNNWEATKFNHNTTAFQLDGKHRDLSCKKCHKKEPLRNKSYINYKLNQFRCEDCH